MGTKRKPHNDFAGYRCERKNVWSGDYSIILDCKLAKQQDSPLVEDYKSEGGRYQVVCNGHGTFQHTTSMPKARKLMRDPPSWCLQCRDNIPTTIKKLKEGKPQ